LSFEPQRDHARRNLGKAITSFHGDLCRTSQSAWTLMGYPPIASLGIEVPPAVLSIADEVIE
jgi:hypothetical protein